MSTRIANLASNGRCQTRDFPPEPRDLRIILRNRMKMVDDRS